MRTRNLLEVGAAALLVGDTEAKMKDQPWKSFGTADMPYVDQLLQPSPVATITNSSSARLHLRAITASKRTKPGLHQIWYWFFVLLLFLFPCIILSFLMLASLYLKDTLDIG